jgi:uncharacterized protein (DUF1501 family)
MKGPHPCRSTEHDLSRRQFLCGAAGGLGLLGFSQLAQPAAARELRDAGKRVLLIWLKGGASQLETWDPKPGTATGGPFQATATSVPGVHVCELLPYTAMQMHRLALVRGVNTFASTKDDHARGTYAMQTGRAREPAMEYPHLGSAMARLLGSDSNPLPGYVHISPKGTGGFNKEDAAFLGPKYGSVLLNDGQPPANLLRPASVTEAADRQRNEVRRHANERFLGRRVKADAEAYTQSYEQAAQLMERREVFDIGKEPAKFRELYGSHDFGRHCLLARRLLEAGVTFVKVSHAEYDTHHENFDFHIEQMGEFDRTFATLIDDLARRGLLETTLVVVMSEFGRTPTINRNYGRDHWSRAWSVVVAGCGLKGGAVVGKTNANGTAVTDREVNSAHLFHTYFRAVGVRKKNYSINGRPIPLAEPQAGPIQELLA